MQHAQLPAEDLNAQAGLEAAAHAPGKRRCLAFAGSPPADAPAPKQSLTQKGPGVSMLADRGQSERDADGRDVLAGSGHRHAEGALQRLQGFRDGVGAQLDGALQLAGQHAVPDEAVASALVLPDLHLLPRLCCEGVS